MGRAAGLKGPDIDVALTARARHWLALGGLLASAALAGCSPPPPVEPIVPLRGEGDVTDIDGDGETTEAAPAPAASAPEQLVWVASEQEALAKCKAERRPMLVTFFADWCADCNRMAKETFGDPRVKKQAGRFVAVKIDATNDEDPQVNAAFSKYSVVGVPTVLLFDSSGHEQRRITELVLPDALLVEISHVR